MTLKLLQIIMLINKKKINYYNFNISKLLQMKKLFIKLIVNGLNLILLEMASFSLQITK